VFWVLGFGAMVGRLVCRRGAFFLFCPTVHVVVGRPSWSSFLKVYRACCSIIFAVRDVDVS